MPDSTIGPQQLYPALLTAGAGLLTTLLTLLFSWLHDKGAVSQRISATKEAFERVQLLEAWYRTRVTVSPDDMEVSRKLVLQELDSAMQSVKALEMAAATRHLERRVQDEVVAKLGWFRRWFLLYNPSRPLAWLPRIFFYVSVVASVVAGAVVGYFGFLGLLPSVRSMDFLEVLLKFSIFPVTCLLARWFALFVDGRSFFRK